MPTYEYECNRCGHSFEKFQSMLDKPLKKCPECGGRVRRLFGTGAGIIFKGSGFYETDYRSESYKSGQKREAQPASSGGGSSKKDSSSTKKKSESTPAGKT